MNQRSRNLNAGQASSAGVRPTRHVGRRAGLFGAVLFLGALALAGVTAAATPVTVGFKDFAYGGGASRVTSDKPQSKLWYTNDSGTITWWGGLFTYSAVAPTKSEFHIWKMTVASGVASNTWTDTGTVVDTRDQSNADYFYDPVAKELYVVSAEPFGCTPAPCDDSIKFFRYSYNSTTKTYTQQGSTVDIATGGTTTASIAKDSTGELWVVYPQGADVKIAHSTDLHVGAAWSAPYRLPSQAVGKDLDPTKDETAAIVAFGGNAVGIMWSNHALATPQTSFAVHADGSDDVTGWPATPEAAVSGAGMSDNHVNLKSDSAGHLYAVTKTTLDGDPIVTKELILLLDRPAGPAGQTWTKHTVSTVADLNTRPQLLLDEELNVVYVFMTAPNGGGAIYSKSAPLTGSQKLVFATGSATVSEPGTPFIQSATETFIDDATTTKQVVDHTTGILVEASDRTSGKQYLHNAITLPATDATAPSGTVSINAGALDTTALAVSVAVPATDAGSGMSLVRLSNTSAVNGSGLLNDASATSFVYTSPLAWTLPAGADGVRTVWVQWRDASGNWSVPTSDAINFVTAKPTGTLDIVGSGGFNFTNTTSVNLALTADDGAGSGVTQVKIANGADPSAAIPQAYAASIPWTLAAGADGVRTVSVQFIDGASIVSDPVVRTITLDSTPPALGTAAIQEGPVVASAAVHVNVPNADASVASVRLSNSSNFSGAVTQAYATPQSWTLAAGDGARSVFVEWADSLGNWTAPVQTASIIVDTVVPSAPTVTAVANASLIAKVSITPAAVDGDVNRVYVQANPGVCPATPSSASIPYVAGTPVSFALSGSAPWSVCAWVQDAVNYSPAVAATVVVDVTNPRPGSAPFARFLATTVGTLPVQLSWTAGTDAGSGIASYFVRRQVDSGAWATIGTTSGRSFNVSLSAGHYYRFGIAPVDGVGNVGPFVYGVRFRALGFQERSTAVRYSRGWALGTSPVYWGGHAKVTRTRLASATFTFTGRAVALVGTHNAGQGWARIYVDGRLAATVNLNSPAASFRQVIFSRAWTTSRTHRVKVVNLATAGHPRLTVDAFLVLR